MSDLPQQDTFNQYTADGISATYNYTYLILIAGDIEAFWTPPGQQANPVADLQNASTYTVTGLGVTGGGTVIFNSIPPIGTVVTLNRNMSISINTSFVNAQTFNGQTLDNAFQRVVLIMQQLASYFKFTGLQYLTDTFLPALSPSPTPYPTNFLPTLTTNQVWSGTSNGIITAATIEANPNISLLRSQLAGTTQGADGTTFVGYYNPYTNTPATLNTFLNSLVTQLPIFYAADTGTANTYAATLPLNVVSYITGMRVYLKVLHANTAASTININSLGTKSIKTTNGNALIANNLIVGMIAELVYDGTNFQLLNPQIGAGSFNFYGASVNFGGSGTTTFAHGVGPVLAQFSTTVFDTNTIWNGTTHAFVPQAQGYYLVTLTNVWATGAIIQADVFKNGAVYRTVYNRTFVNTEAQCGSVIVPCNGSTDSIQLYFTITSGSDGVLTNANCSFQIAYMGYG